MEKVKLVAISKPTFTLDVGDFGSERDMTTEEFIAFCARVSNPTNQLNTGTTDKLLKYLVRNKHWSPFEMVSLTLEIKTTRDIGRQILRHRSFSFQEFSQRYAEVKAEDFISDREARLQDTKNRQNSIEANNQYLQTSFEMMQKNVVEYSLKCYNQLLENGVAKEVARSVLPEGLTPTHMYMAGTLRSWIHYCQLRMGNGTQKEHQEIAKECWEVITKEIPSLKDILNENTN